MGDPTTNAPAPTGNEHEHAGRREALPLAVLVVLIIVLYGRIRGYAFTNWDDTTFIVDNPLLRPDPKNLIRLLTPGTVPHEHLYIPITYASYLLESIVFGLRSSVLHTTNLLLHAVNAMLLYAIARRYGNQLVAFTAAGLFALHPLQVETVAWCMGRKDLLATMFALLTIVCWQYCRRSIRSWRQPAVALIGVCLLLAVLSKPSVIVLPLILAGGQLLEDRRIDRLGMLLYTLLAVICTAVFFLNHSDNALPLVPDLWTRILTVPALVWHWASRIFPVQQNAAYYPWPSPNIGMATILSLCVGLLFALIAFYHPQVRIGLLWFALGMMPIAQVLISSRRFFTADRYAYFPLAGLCIAAAIGLAQLRHRKVWIAAAMAIGFALSWQRSGAWENSKTLWQAQIQRYPNHHQGYSGLGRFLEQEGKLKSALAAYDKAIASATDDHEVFYNHGNVLTALGDYNNATLSYRKAIQHKPNYVEAMVNLGRAFLYAERPENAIIAWEHAAKYDSPYRFEIIMNLAAACSQIDRPEAAATYLATALRLNPESTEAKALQTQLQKKTGAP